MNFNQEINHSHKGQRTESNNIVQSNDGKNRHLIADAEWGDYVDKKIHIEEPVECENWQDKSRSLMHVNVEKESTWREIHKGNYYLTDYDDTIERWGQNVNPQ